MRKKPKIKDLLRHLDEFEIVTNLAQTKWPDFLSDEGCTETFIAELKAKQAIANRKAEAFINQWQLIRDTGSN